jgi:transposase
MLKRWIAFTRFLDDGRICLPNYAAERGVRGIAAPWRRRAGRRDVQLIVTAKMNDIDPRAWLADVLGHVAEHPVQKLDELLPWNWRRPPAQSSQAA